MNFLWHAITFLRQRLLVANSGIKSSPWPFWIWNNFGCISGSIGYPVNLQPPDFRGFMEAWLDGNWHLFDASRMAPPDRLLRVGTAREPADTALCQYCWSRQNAINRSLGSFR
jgi:hypothetical protein